MDLTQLCRSIVETSPDGIWVIDLDGRTIFANAEIARTHRVSQEEMASLTVFDTLDEQGGAQLAAHLAEVRDTGRLNQHDVEVQWVRSDGTITWTLCREAALRGADGRIQALLHRHSSYEERRSLIESLRAHEVALADEISQKQLLQAVASTANGATSMADVLRHARSLILLHDDWERARGFVPESPGSTTMVPFYTVESDRETDEADPFAAIELALAQRCADERHLVWDDRRLTLAIPVLLDTEVQAVIVITSAPPLFRFELIESMAAQVAQQLAQVAERERTQTQLAQARDEAMETSRLKSEFLATMSHEIRTPLNGLVGLNNLLLRTPLDAEQTRLVTGLQVSGRALLGLINDILDFSKIEAGRLELEAIAFEVAPLIDEVLAVQAEAAREKGITITAACDDALPEALTGDPTKVAQVVTNLVSNAVKFTSKGSISVDVGGEPAPDGAFLLRVAVRDTGVGVSPASVSRLFEPFTQADSSTTRLYGGTGLGLAISRELASAMDGDIIYEPNPEGGSIFTFTAVLGAASREDVVAVVSAHEHLPDRAKPPNRGLVLVVEDNPVNQLVAAGLLAALGYGVVTADDGQSGIEAAARTEFAAILMDVQMPVLDGYAASRAIRAAESGSRVPIIAMTAAAVEGVQERCLEAGMDDFLTKPVDVDRLADTLDRWVVRANDATPSLERLDLKRLDELRELDGGTGETSYVARAIGNLLGSAPRDLDAMDEAAGAGDSDRLGALAHRLAGAALNLGASLGGEAARHLEEVVRNGDPSADLPTLLAQVREALAEDLRALAILRDRLVGTSS
ncbi:hybrid sensor histidine kinase/response regulator [Nocardioides dilutus]